MLILQVKIQAISGLDEAQFHFDANRLVLCLQVKQQSGATLHYLPFTSKETW